MLIRVMIVGECSYALRIFHRLSRWMLTNAFMKPTQIGGPIQTLFDDVAQSEIWSMHPLSFLTPVCFFRSLMSMAALIRFRRILQKIVLRADSIVIPRQLLQFRGPPVGKSLTKVHFVQSCGMMSLFHMLLKRSVNTLDNVLLSTLSISACIQSIPDALPFSWN